VRSFPHLAMWFRSDWLEPNS